MLSYRSNSHDSSTLKYMASRCRSSAEGSRYPWMILLSWLSQNFKSLAIWFCRIPDLNICSLRFGYMVTHPDPASESFRDRSTIITPSALLFSANLGVIEAIVSFVALAFLPVQEQPKQFLALELGSKVCQDLSSCLPCSYHNKHTVTGGA